MKRRGKETPEKQPVDELIQPVTEDIKKMTIEEAIRQGIMPISPVEMAKTGEEIVELTKGAGMIYGSGLHAIWSAVRRKDLPMDVRLAKGAKGFMALMGMMLAARDTFEALIELEESSLTPEQEDKSTDLDELLDRLEKLTKENEELRKQLKKERG